MQLLAAAAHERGGPPKRMGSAADTIRAGLSATVPDDQDEAAPDEPRPVRLATSPGSTSARSSRRRVGRLSRRSRPAPGPGCSGAAAFLAAAFFAAAFLAGAFFAAVFFAGAFFAVAFLAGAFFAAVFLAGVFLAGVFLAGAVTAGAADRPIRAATWGRGPRGW